MARPVGIPEIDICKDVAQFLARVFIYTSDGPKDHWRSREEIAAQLKAGVLKGDCDDWAWAAVYGMADHGIKARVILCWCEPGSGPNPYHAVAESEKGYVLDSRFPGLVLTWADHPLCEYAKDKMSGFSEFGESQWHSVKREEQT